MNLEIVSKCIYIYIYRYLGGGRHLPNKNRATLWKNRVIFCPVSGGRPNDPPSRKINENGVFSHLSLTTQRKDQ